MEIPEETLAGYWVVSERIHNVVPTRGVQIASWLVNRGDGLGFEHVGHRQRHAAHVHHVEYAMGALQIIRGDDDQRHHVDHVGGQRTPLFRFHTG